MESTKLLPAGNILTWCRVGIELYESVIFPVKSPFLFLSADADFVCLWRGGNGNEEQGGGRSEDGTSDSADEVSET